MMYWFAWWALIKSLITFPSWSTWTCLCTLWRLSTDSLPLLNCPPNSFIFTFQIVSILVKVSKTSTYKTGMTILRKYWCTLISIIYVSDWSVFYAFFCSLWSVTRSSMFRNFLSKFKLFVSNSVASAKQQLYFVYWSNWKLATFHPSETLEKLTWQCLIVTVQVNKVSANSKSNFYAGTEMWILFIDAFLISHRKSFANIPHSEILAKVGVNGLKLNTFGVENL